MVTNDIKMGSMPAGVWPTTVKPLLILSGQVDTLYYADTKPGPKINVLCFPFTNPHSANTSIKLTRINCIWLISIVKNPLDCKTVGFFFTKSVKKSVKCGVRVLARRACEAREKKIIRIFSVSPQSRSLFSALFQTFCLTARAYFNTQKYGLFCSLKTLWRGHQTELTMVVLDYFLEIRTLVE